MKHQDIPIGYRHPIHNIEYDDATERTAATGLAAGKLYNIALQLDDFSLWLITAIDGSGNPTWVDIGNLASVTLSSLGALFHTRAIIAGAYTVVAGDKGKLLEATTGTWTLTLTAAATLGDGFCFAVLNSGSGVVTVDPDGSETLFDAAGSATTKDLAEGEAAIIFCTGAGFLMMKFSLGGVRPSVAVAALEIDWKTGEVFRKTLAANSTFTFANSADGKTIVVALTNTASNYTVTWPTVQWSGGTPPVQTLGAKTDVYTFVNVNGTIYGAVSADHS